MFCNIVNSVRVLKIFVILVRYNVLPYSYFVSKKSVRKKSPGEKIALALQNLGPTFIKFGQTLASRVDIVGDDIANNLLSLCDKLPAFSYEYVIKTIESDFHCKIDDLFTEFSEEPVAAASIAQVHKAITIDGNIRAVKILRPNIKKIFAEDIKLLLWLAHLAEKFIKNSKRLKPKVLVETFAKISKMELDLRFEAANAIELKDNTQKDSGFYVPYVDWPRTSERVLTTEWIDGIPIYEVEKLNNRDELAKNLILCFCNQVYRDCFFHADMHPGNLMIDKNNNIVAVDFGIMGRIDKITCIYVAEILYGFSTRDYKHVAEIHFRAGYVSRKHDNFITACRAIGEPIVGQSVQNISAATLLAQLFKITADFDMPVQPQLLLLQKTMVLVEGMCRQLCPEINIWHVAELWIKEHSSKKNKYIEQTKNSFLVKMFKDIPLFTHKLDKVLDIIIENQRFDQNKPSAALSNRIILLLLLIIAIGVLLLYV